MPPKPTQPRFSPAVIVALLLLATLSFVVWKVGVFTGIISLRFSPIIISLLVILPIILLITVIATRKIYNIFLSYLYVVGVMWFILLLYLFMGAVLIALLSLIPFFTSSILLLFAQIVVLFVVTVVIFGVINSYWIRTTKYVVDSKELVGRWSGKKIVLFSDTHMGTVRGAKFLKKVVGMINDLEPDLVILAGDVIDGPVIDYVKYLAPLKAIKAPLIYTPGNHEGYNMEPEKFYPVIESLTHMLVDKKIMINGTQIVGLTFMHEKDEETRARLYATGFDQTVPSIVIMHDPTHTRVLEDEKASLVVSGHTHKGQFFPSTLFMKRLYKEFAYGKNVKGNTTTITTSGVGTTFSPVRLGSNPENCGHYI